MFKSYANPGLSFSSVVRNDYSQTIIIMIIPENGSNALLNEIKNIMVNLSTQLVNLQQQLQIQKYDNV